MATVATWKSLRKVKKFRLDQFNREVDQAKEYEAQCKKQEDETRERENECKKIEENHQNKILALSTSGQFKVGDFLTMKLIAESLAVDTQNAQKETLQAEQQTQHAHQQVLDALKVVKRAEDQLERVQEQLEKAIKQVEAEQEDAQDEESEETSVARMLARTRQENKLKEMAE
jgi:predicted O-linked N-acetylglucosamine transferase (SPINDLY family)